MVEDTLPDMEEKLISATLTGNLKLQKRLKYKVKSQKNRSTPPTAKTPRPNWLIFWRENLHVNTFGLTEAIFEFHPGSRDMGPSGAL